MTLDGQSADLTCGIPVVPLCSLSDSLAGDALFVIAGFNHQKYLTKQNQLLIKQVSRNFKVVGGIEAGSWILARCGLLNQKNATTHWEDQEEFALLGIESLLYERIQALAAIRGETLGTVVGELLSLGLKIALARDLYAGLARGE